MYWEFEKTAAQAHYDELLAEVTTTLVEWAKFGARFAAAEALELDGTYENELDTKTINDTVTKEQHK